MALTQTQLASAVADRAELSNGQRLIDEQQMYSQRSNDSGLLSGESQLLCSARPRLVHGQRAGAALVALTSSERNVVVPKPVVRFLDRGWCGR